MKNIDDTWLGLEQCTWRCLTPGGCNTSLAHPERSDCCDPAELQLLDDVCRPVYHNFSNIDSDAGNPTTSDPDLIADVCEDAASSKPHVTLDSLVTMEPRLIQTPGGIEIVIQAGQVCTESRVKVEVGLYGGSNWDVSNSTRYEIKTIEPISRLGEIGACGCNNTWSNCEAYDCPEDQESYWLTKAWLPIDSLQCSQLSDMFGPPGPGGTLCDLKETVHTRDEDCSDAVCSFMELYWPWRNQTTVQAGDSVKVRVGLRLPTETWQQNAMYPSQNHVTLPAVSYSCVPANLNDPDEELDLDSFRHLIPHEPPQLPFEEHLGSQVLTRDPVSKDLYVFEFDKQMRGPLHPRRLTYASPDTPRIEETRFAAVMGRVKSHLYGFEGTGTQSLFVFGRREVPCPDCADPGAMISQSELWVAGMGEGLDKIDLAEEVFGSGRVRPPAMVRPLGVYDRTMSRLIVAGGGESGHFGVWAYTPHIGRWHYLSTPLPADLEGVAMAFDRARHRLYLLGGQSEGQDLTRLVVVDLVKGTVSEQTAPAVLARSNHAMAIDPVNRHLYVFGGRRGDQLLGDLWHLDLETRAWTQVGDGTDPTGPGARDQARMHFERRYGRLWISGGRDDAGAKMPTLWGFATALNLWQERPLAPEKSPDGSTLSGLFSPDAPVVWEVSIDETVPYPGQVTRIGLTSDDPCVGLQVWDAAGERVAMSNHCDTAERAVTFLGQPGERYVVELNGLAGFALGVPSGYDLRLDEATLVPVGHHTVGPAWARPRDLAVVAADTGPVALALGPFALWTVDLLVPEAPLTLGSLQMPGLATSVSTRSPDEVVVSLVGPGVADLRPVDVGDPAHLALAGAIHLPGLAGRMAAHWRGGRVYTARAGKVEVVDLTGPARPEHVGSKKVGGLISCLAVHGDRLYLCIAHPGRLKVYDLDRHQGANLAEEVTLDEIGESVRVHGDTVHVGELPFWRYLVCKVGGSCNTGGQVEVFRFDTAGVLGSAGMYPMGVNSLPYLELTGTGGLRIADGGFDIYRVEAAP